MRSQECVLEVLDDGGLRVACKLSGGRVEDGRGQELSGAYVAREVELGYARNVHGGQGLAVDTGHALVPIRGTGRHALDAPRRPRREENHVYIETEARTDAGESMRVEQPLAVLARSVEQRSATEIRDAELAAAGSIAGSDLGRPHRRQRRDAVAEPTAPSIAADLRDLVPSGLNGGRGRLGSVSAHLVAGAAGGHFAPAAAVAGAA